MLYSAREYDSEYDLEQCQRGPRPISRETHECVSREIRAIYCLQEIQKYDKIIYIFMNKFETNA